MNDAIIVDGAWNTWEFLLSWVDKWRFPDDNPQNLAGLAVVLPISQRKSVFCSIILKVLHLIDEHSPRTRILHFLGINCHQVDDLSNSCRLLCSTSQSQCLNGKKTVKSRLDNSVRSKRVEAHHMNAPFCRQQNWEPIELEFQPARTKRENCWCTRKPRRCTQTFPRPAQCLSSRRDRQPPGNSGATCHDGIITVSPMKKALYLLCFWFCLSFLQNASDKINC